MNAVITRTKKVDLLRIHFSMYSNLVECVPSFVGFKQGHILLVC